MTRIALPALIVMLAVAGMIGVAGWNTSGEPRQVITLTERELSLPFRMAAPGDDPGLPLILQYQRRGDPLESRNWLPESRLREIGFALHVPAGSPQAAHTYDHVPPRMAWVVLEYDGPAWRQIEQRRALQRDELRPRRELPSRLVPVDAGPDYDQLRARYPDALILRGIIGLSYVPPTSGGPLVHGTLRGLVPARIAVPYEFRGLLRGLAERPPDAPAQPRYEAEIAVGRLGTAYLRRVTVVSN